MLGSLCEGRTVIDNFAPGADNRSTVAVFRALGVEITMSDDEKTVHVEGVGREGLKTPEAPLDCGNSGTTIRLVSGMLAGLGIKATLIGDASLSKRPMRRIVQPLTELGGRIVASGPGETTPIEVLGEKGFQGGRCRLKIASAQVKSSLLLASLVSGRGMLVQEPSPSRDHTEVMFRYLGIPMRSSEHYTHPWKGGHPDVMLSEHTGAIKARPMTVPGDISSAAFLMVAAAIVSDSEVVLEACGMSPTRTGILDALEGAGVKFRLTRQRRVDGGEPVADVVVTAGDLKGFHVGSADVPRLIDEIPVLAVLAGRAAGQSVFEGVAELRVKESDRLEKTAELLRICGREVEVIGDEILKVHGDPNAPFTAFEYDAEDDHRMAAAAMVASLCADGPCQIHGMECLAVSYPHLGDDLASLQEVSK